MKLSLLHKQGHRTTHTPAIFDSGHRAPETGAVTGLVESTALLEAVHSRGPLASPPSVCAASDAWSRP